MRQEENRKQYSAFTKNLSREFIPAKAANPAVYEDISPRCMGIWGWTLQCCWRKLPSPLYYDLQPQLVGHPRGLLPAFIFGQIYQARLA